MARGSACVMGRPVRLSSLPTPTGHSPAVEWYRWYSKGIAGLRVVPGEEVAGQQARAGGPAPPCSSPITTRFRGSPSSPTCNACTHPPLCGASGPAQKARQ